MVCQRFPVPPKGWWRLPRGQLAGWGGRGGLWGCEALYSRGLFMSLQLCLFGHEKALSFHAAVPLSKVKGGFTSQAEQIADGSSHDVKLL